MGAEPAARAEGPACLPVALTLCGAATLATFAAILFVQFHLDRPVNLAPQTDALAEAIVQSLERRFVPRTHIERRPPEAQSGGNMHWTFHAFAVTVPATVDPRGIAQLVRRDLLEYNVSVAPADAAGAALDFAIAGRRFAQVQLEGEPVEALRRGDFRGGGAQVQREVGILLEALGVPPGARAELESGVRRDAAAQWAYARWRAPLPEGVSAGELRGRIEDRLAARDVRVTTAPAPYGATVIAVAYAGRPCLDLEAAPAPKPAAVPGAPGAPSLPGLPPWTDAGAFPHERAGLPRFNTAALPPLNTGVLPARPAPPPAELLPLESAAEGEPAPPPPGPRVDTPRVAILLDDGGYGGETTERILAELDPGLTLAILPGTPAARETAARAAAAGFEVMLHMPMQSRDPGERFPGQLESGMSAEAIGTATRAALAEAPGAVGVNNHTGSAFTADADGMRAFMAVVRDAGLYFVDSMTIGASQGLAVAQAMGVRAARRDIFLDNTADPAYIRGQFDKLVLRARAQGQAIGIGHFRPATVDALAELLPQLEAEGIELVHASELVQ